MTKLTDLQLVLLSSAAARADGSLLPPPDSIASETARIAKAIPALIKRGFVAEGDAAGAAQTWRKDSERRISAVITDAGRDAIGAPRPDSDNLVSKRPEAAEPEANSESARPTKAALVQALLRRDQGATLAELVDATGWLPHTTRAALTGLRKKGHTLAKSKRDEVTCYRIAAKA